MWINEWPDYKPSTYAHAHIGIYTTDVRQYDDDDDDDRNFKWLKIINNYLILIDTPINTNKI